MAGVVYYGVLWAAAGNDLIAITFNVPLFATTWFLRVGSSSAQSSRSS